MKKLISLLLCVLVFLSIICIAGCNSCEHEFEWKLFKEGNCIEADLYEGLCVKCGEKSVKKGDKKEHAYDSFGICEVCGEKKGEGGESQSIDDYIIKATEIRAMNILSVSSIHSLAIDNAGNLTFLFNHPIKHVLYRATYKVELCDYQSLNINNKTIYGVEVDNEGKVTIIYSSSIQIFEIDELKGFLINNEKEAFLVYKNNQIVMVGIINLYTY